MPYISDKLNCQLNRLMKKPDIYIFRSLLDQTNPFHTSSTKFIGFANVTSQSICTAINVVYKASYNLCSSFYMYIGNTSPLFMNASLSTFSPVENFSLTSHQRTLSRTHFLPSMPRQNLSAITYFLYANLLRFYSIFFYLWCHFALLRMITISTSLPLALSLLFTWRSNKSAKRIACIYLFYTTICIWSINKPLTWQLGQKFSLSFPLLFWWWPKQ